VRLSGTANLQSLCARRNPTALAPLLASLRRMRKREHLNRNALLQVRPAAKECN